jgi:tRNA modification GTPase
MIHTSLPDTIFALSSGRGRSGVAVVRVSGPEARAAIKHICGTDVRVRMAELRRLRDPNTGETLDRALVLLFEGPASFTGEDVGEFHIHGGPAVIDGVLSALGALCGLRGAEPGEFARRAFENGKLDLTQAEGLADLIDAETQAQRRQALRQSGGNLRTLCEGWRNDVIQAASLVEAALDFSDEADVPALIEEKAQPVIRNLVDAISAHLDDPNRGERVRDGLQVVLAGAPNAGKSSLLNALGKRDAAIVSDEPGTTRDAIEVHLDLAGFPVTLIDTAGLHVAAGKVEQEGIRRTLNRAGDADLVLWLVDGQEPEWTPPEPVCSGAAELMCILNKCDIARPNPPGKANPITISARTGAGLHVLLSELGSRASRLMAGGEPPVVTRARQRRELEACRAALRRFLEGDPTEHELRAEDLRAAGHALGRLSGRVDVEDVLDQIFGDFCIGK